MDAGGLKPILLIAYHFPPVAGSSGVQRTLNFARYLPEFGWRPAVLTVHPRAYPLTAVETLGQVPAGTRVVRGFAMDTARHLAVFGRYPRWLALPDRWWTWLIGALPAGLEMVRRDRPRLLWATYPVPSALLVGLALHRLTGIPLVADLRDSMVDDSFPYNPAQRRAHRWIEERVVRGACRITFTAPGTRELYARRYPAQPANRWGVIPNGYDEQDFMRVETEILAPPRDGTRITLVHAGLVDPVDRDPDALLQALSTMKGERSPGVERLEIRFRGADGNDALRRRVSEYGLDDMVTLAPPLPYDAALAEMMAVDALLLLQGTTCNHQIPAKLYEYARTGRPVLALTDPAGDTAEELQRMGFGTCAPLDDPSAIAATLKGFFARLEQGSESGCELHVARQHTRRERTREFAAMLNEVDG
ncbi:MAG: glycosyltransferase [Gammaproteobacteria bacterium]|nr:glycosyltransferase [Gammaproteobacteria bacterium]